MIVDYSELGLMVCSRMRPVGETHGGVAHLAWSPWWRATTPLACEHKRREGADNVAECSSSGHIIMGQHPVHSSSLIFLAIVRTLELIGLTLLPFPGEIPCFVRAMKFLNTTWWFDRPDRCGFGEEMAICVGWHFPHW